MSQRHGQEGIAAQLESIFGADDKPIMVGRAPGRVNLIGEHTDYNDGFVFPMAIDFEMRMAGRKRADRMVRIYSQEYQRTVEFSLDNITFDGGERWSNYPRGVLAELQEAGLELPGMDLAFSGNIPQGAGLSSSAALEVVTAVLARELARFAFDDPKLARLCQRAENEFVGMKCGIMDPFISLMGQKGHALFLDCRSLEFRHIPLALGAYRVVICKSGVKHSLVDSEYNVRRRQCEEGVAVLSKRFWEVWALRDVTPEQLERCRPELDPVVYRRCRHIVEENGRVVESVAALTAGDLARFGQLMNASHDSLRDLYEVSCPEIDRLVELARSVPGVLGARITGGGFGGCTVNLVAESAIPEFERMVLEPYRKETGIEPELFVSTPAAGAEILPLF